MIHLDLTLEDLRIIARRKENLTYPWFVELIDFPSGRQTEITWTNAQFAAVLALAVNGDEFSEHGLSESTIAQLYDIAEPLCTNLHKYLRPIP